VEEEDRESKGTDERGQRGVGFRRSKMELEERETKEGPIYTLFSSFLSLFSFSFFLSFFLFLLFLFLSFFLSFFLSLSKKDIH